MDMVFTAVADPTRRTILDRLRTDGPLSIRALSDGLPITRQAVSKHLGILLQAQLISRERRGRERLHRLTAEPLCEIRDWLDDYSAVWGARLDRLKAHVEQGHEAPRQSSGSGALDA